MVSPRLGNAAGFEGQRSLGDELNVLDAGFRLHKSLSDTLKINKW
jgi:hypothetical protein